MKNLLKEAAYEIRDLRRRNEILSAKVEVMDLFAMVLNTEPARRGQGMSSDVAWQLDKAATEIEEKEKLEKPAA